MKQLFRNNYITVSLVKGLLLGVGYDGDSFIVMVGCIAFEFQTYMFKRKRKRNKSSKPQSF